MARPKTPTSQARAEFDRARRTFLQGTGAVIALPFLPSLLPRAAWAATATPPTRFLMYFVPMGMLPDAWVPGNSGSGYTLSPSLAPLAAHKANFTVISNLDNSQPNQSTATGGHAKGTGAFATCSPVSQQPKVVQVGTSADQIVAAAISGNTRLQSMQLALSSEVTNDGSFSSTYNSCISYSSATSSMPAISKPTAIFARLFPNGTVQGASASKAVFLPSRAIKPSVQKSILDGAIAQAASLQKRLGAKDAQVLDQYLTGVREAERALGDVTESDAPSTGNGGTTPPPGNGNVGVPSSQCTVPGVPVDGDDNDYQARWALLSKLMPLAFQCDQTRVISFMFAPGESYRVYGHLGTSAKHHFMSHYNTAAEAGDKGAALAMLKKIQVYEMQCFAQLLANMKNVQESNGTLLDNSVIYFSSEMSDSADHNYNNMPVLIAGGGSGRLRGQGQHIALGKSTEYARALLTAMRATGAQIGKFGAQAVTAPIDGML